MTIVFIGLAVIVIAGVIITVLVAKSKKAKEAETVNLELPPEIAAAVENYDKKGKNPQTNNEDFFADLDKKKGVGEQSATETPETPPEADGSPATVGEMDSLTLPETSPEADGPLDEMPALELPESGGAAENAFDTAENSEETETPVGEMSADEFLNKDFLKM
jgi:hypothetical protein